MPFFYLIGAPKSGTSDIYKILRFHRNFRSRMKEPHWITRFRLKTYFDAYTAAIARPLADKQSSGKDFEVTRDELFSTAVLGR